jgi:hypothetical protein
MWVRNNPQLQTKDMLLAVPFNKAVISSGSIPVLRLIMDIPTAFFGEIVAHNIVILLSFSLTSFTSYLLIYYLLRRSLPAFVGGLIFGFCPGVVMSAVAGHLSFTFNMFIPLFLLALFNNSKKRTLVSAFYVALSYALLTLTSLYFGFFSLFIALLFVIYDYLTSKDCIPKRLLFNYIFAALIAFVMIIPFQFEIILHIISTSHVELATTGRIHEYKRLISSAASVLDYLLPSIDHPVLGRFIGDMIGIHLQSGNLFARTLYLGFTPLLLSLAGFFLWSKRHYSLESRRYFLFFSAGAVLMIFFSLPPFIYWGYIKVPTLSHFMYGIAPMFRVYARFGILANLFMAVTAAVVLSELSDRIEKAKYVLLLTALLPALIFEYWSVPPYYAKDVSETPAVYQWLAGEPDDTIIAEYPMMEYNKASFYTYLFWQRIHRKRMVNGAAPLNKEAWDFYQQVKDLSSDETPQLLRTAGVRYIIIHKKIYQDGDIPEPLKRYHPAVFSKMQYNGGKVPMHTLLNKPFKVFGDDSVYRLDH